MPHPSEIVPITSKCHHFLLMFSFLFLFVWEWAVACRRYFLYASVIIWQRINVYPQGSSQNLFTLNLNFKVLNLFFLDFFRILWHSVRSMTFNCWHMLIQKVNNDYPQKRLFQFHLGATYQRQRSQRQNWASSPLLPPTSPNSFLTAYCKHCFDLSWMQYSLCRYKRKPFL